MKRFLCMALVVGLVMGFSVVAMAGLATEQFDVYLNILPHATIVVPTSMDFGDIDFADGFARRSVEATFQIYTNADLHITVKSNGFGAGAPLDGWQGWISYYLYPPNRTALSCSSVAWLGTYDPMDAPVPFTGDVTEIPFKAFLEANESDWFKIKAGSYSDLITVTVSASQQ